MSLHSLSAQGLSTKPSHPSLHRWTLQMEQKSPDHPSSLAGPKCCRDFNPPFYLHYTVTPSCYSCTAMSMLIQSRLYSDFTIWSCETDEGLQLQALKKTIQGKERLQNPGQTWLHFYRMPYGYMAPWSKTPIPHRPRTLSSVP